MKTRRTYEILLALVALLLACCSESPRSVVPGGNNDGSVLPDDASSDAEQIVQDQPPFYVLDLQSSYLNCFGGCAGQVKARGADKVLRDLDTLMVAMSIQGIVNRKGPRLYVLSTGADQFWLDQATAVGKPWAWAVRKPKKILANLNEVIDLFGSEITGTARWNAKVPAGLNVATMAAAQEDLAVVREGSAIEAEIVARLPLKRDLVAAFANKREAFAYARTNYLAKSKPGFLGYQLDGEPWQKLLAGSAGADFDPPFVTARDYLISEKAFLFDLSPWADETPRDDPGAPPGADVAEMIALLDLAHAAMSGKRALPTVWGFYMIAKYTSAKHPEPGLGEWEVSKLFSQHGVRLSGSGGQAYGLEAGNASFHKWGTFPTHAPRNASPTPSELADLGYINQFALNPGFEWGNLGAWGIDTKNRVVYRAVGAPGGGDHFLEMNADAAGQSVYQDIATPPNTNETWRARLKFRMQPGATARMVLWAAGGPGNEPAQINLAPADGAWHDAEVLLNPKMAGHTGLRFQVFVDTVGVNVAIDELRVARVTPWDDHVSPLTYTLFQEMDYDFGTPIYTIPEAVSPLVWRNKARGSLPLAWDFAPDTIDYYPGVMAYFYATRSNKDYFTAANSGAGYVNPSFMPLADRATYIKTSRRAMGRFGESFLSFFLNGLAASPGDDVMQQWNAVAIDGAIANQLVTPSRRMVGNVPWVELDTNGWSYGGIEQAVANKNLELAYNARYGAPPPGSAARFLVGRNIYTGPDMASSILAANRTLHPERDYTAVDPYTFGYLFRRLNGGTNTRRASWMSDDLPRALLPGDKRVVNFAVRNDGWDMWSAAACVLGVLFSTDDDVSPKSGAPLLIPLSKDTAPGEVVKWSAAIDAPTGEGKYTMSYDLRCAGAWFEDANNIVYKDAVEVVAKRDF